VRFLPKVSEAYLEARRNQILDAAWACFGRGGYHETTMQDICKESGLSYGALYRYFDSKEAILRATSERSQSEALNVIATAHSQGMDALDALHALGQAVFGTINQPECDAATKVHIETLPEVLRRPELIESLATELGAWRSSMTALLAEARDSGHLSALVDPEGLAVLLMCTWEGLRVHHLLDPEHFRPELVLMAIDALMAGVAAPKEAVAG
jgi:AcrR family transcriptional regulator